MPGWTSWKNCFPAKLMREVRGGQPGASARHGNGQVVLSGATRVWSSDILPENALKAYQSTANRQPPKSLRTLFLQEIKKKRVIPSPQGRGDERGNEDIVAVRTCDETCPLVQCEVNGCAVCFLIDTGSKVTLITEEAFEMVTRDGLPQVRLAQFAEAAVKMPRL